MLGELREAAAVIRDGDPKHVVGLLSIKRGETYFASIYRARAPRTIEVGMSGREAVTQRA